MRYVHFVVVWLSMLVAPALAEHGELAGYSPQKSVGPAIAPAAAPAEPAMSPGYFAAPPQTGTVAAGTDSYGVDGFALHFPALTFKLPTLQLPSLFKMRTNPRMLLDPGQAPYVQSSPLAYGASAVPLQAWQAQSQPAAKVPQQRAEEAHVPAQKHDSASLELERQLGEREQQLAVLDERVARLAQSVGQIARLTEQAAAMDTEAETLEQAPPVRWVEPIEAAEVRHASEAPHQASHEVSGRELFAANQTDISPVRRLPPTRVQAVRFLSVPNSAGHVEDAGHAALSPVPPSRSGFSTRSASGHRRAERLQQGGLQWFHLAGALGAGLVIGGALMRRRQAIILVGECRPLLLGTKLAGYLGQQTISSVAPSVESD